MATGTADWNGILTLVRIDLTAGLSHNKAFRQKSYASVIIQSQQCECSDCTECFQPVLLSQAFSVCPQRLCLFKDHCRYAQQFYTLDAIAGLGAWVSMAAVESRPVIWTDLLEMVN